MIFLREMVNMRVERHFELLPEMMSIVVGANWKPLGQV